jgi:hypothetical protein
MPGREVAVLVSPSVWVAAALFGTGSADAAAPSVARYTRTALDPRKDEADRARAIVAIAGVSTEEAGSALTDIAEKTVDDPGLQRVAIAARLQNAGLEDLALTDWPDWATPLVETRLAEVLPTRCADPVVRELPLVPEQVVATCRADLPPAELARAVVVGEQPIVREQAVKLLVALSTDDPAPVADALAASFAWDEPTPWVGEGAALGVAPLPDDARRQVATELVTRRIAVVQVGLQEVPPRLDAELRAVLAPELASFGVPSQSIDWLHLLAAAGGDPHLVLVRLRLDTDHHYTVVLDEDLALQGTPRELLPLLAHRSPIVRARAARRLEQQPEAAITALRRAWRFEPGRGVPLRGDVGTPSLVRDEADAMRWERTLVHWARRSSNQRDDSALRATLWFVSCPATTAALPETYRIDTAQALLRTARRDDDPSRVVDMVQGMDAVLRGVPFDQGARPAPEEVEVALDAWGRMRGPTRGSEIDALLGRSLAPAEPEPEEPAEDADPREDAPPVEEPPVAPEPKGDDAVEPEVNGTR